MQLGKRCPPFDERCYYFINQDCFFLYCYSFSCIMQTRPRETKRLKDATGSSTEMNYSPQYDTVILVDWEGLTGRSDAGLTDKAAPIIGCLLQKQDTSPWIIQSQQHTSAIDFHSLFLAPNMSQCGQKCHFISVSNSWALHCIRRVLVGSGFSQIIKPYLHFLHISNTRKLSKTLFAALSIFLDVRCQHNILLVLI